MLLKDENIMNLYKKDFLKMIWPRPDNTKTRSLWERVRNKILFSKKKRVLPVRNYKKTSW